MEDVNERGQRERQDGRTQDNRRQREMEDVKGKRTGSRTQEAGFKTQD